MNIFSKIFRSLFPKKEEPISIRPEFTMTKEEFKSLSIKFNRLDKDSERDEFVQTAIYNLSNASKTPREEIAHYLAHAEDPRFRRAVAAYSRLSEKTENQLAQDEDRDVAKQIARRPNLSDDTLKLIVDKDDEFLIREATSRHGSRVSDLIFSTKPAIPTNKASTGKIDIQKIKNLRSQGYPVSKIAKLMNLSEKTIYKYLK